MHKNIFLILYEIGIKKIILFGLLNIVVLFFELLSFTMFIPLLLVITSKEKLISNEYFEQFLNLFNISNDQTTQILFLLLIILVIVFFIKNLVIGFSKFYQYKISYDIEINLTSMVFQKYLRKPYLFHTTQNSSKALRNIVGETAMFSRAFLGSVLSLIIETVVLIGIFSILYLNQPEVVTKLILCFVIFGLIFFIFFKKKFSSLGKERQTQDSNRIKYAQQGIQGIKEIIAFNLQNFILKLFRKSNSSVLKSIHYAGFINQIPKLLLEFLAIIIVVVIFFTTEEIQKDPNQQIFVLGLVAAAAFRLFPAINKILLSLNSFQYSKPSVNVLSQIFKDDFQNQKNNFLNSNKKLKKITLKNFIEIKDLNFKYPSAEKKIFKNLNLKINKGEHIGIIGKTGSGKSTFVDLLLGIINPDSGKILSDNESVLDNLHNWRKLIGYVSQFPYLLDGSVIANIAIGEDETNIDENKVIKSLEVANLKNLILNLSNGLNTQIGERGAQLSGGQIQRLAIARALYRNPKILILDEATASVDSATQKNIIDDLNKFKNEITLISISHNKDALVHCNKIYELKDSNLMLYK